MATIPWFVWIVLGGLVFVTVASVTDTIAKNRRKIAELQAVPTRHEVAARLDAIEAQLDRIERALTEIPG